MAKKNAWEMTFELHDRPLRKEKWIVRLQRSLGLRGKFR